MKLPQHPASPRKYDNNKNLPIRDYLLKSYFQNEGMINQSRFLWQLSCRIHVTMELWLLKKHTSLIVILKFNQMDSHPLGKRQINLCQYGSSWGPPFTNYYKMLRWEAYYFCKYMADCITCPAVTVSNNSSSGNNLWLSKAILLILFIYIFLSHHSQINLSFYFAYFV